MESGEKQDITNEIFKQLGMSVPSCSPGTASLASSQPAPGEKEGKAGKDVSRRKQKSKKAGGGRSEDEAWVWKEARLELATEKRGGEFKPSQEVMKFLEGES